MGLEKRKNEKMENKLVEINFVTASPSEALVYQYGFRPDPDCIHLIEDQFRKASQLYNEVIATCRKISSDAHNDVIDCAGQPALNLLRSIDLLNDQFSAAKASSDQQTMKEVAQARREKWAELKPILNEVRVREKTRLKEQYYSKIGTTVGTVTYAQCTDSIARGLGGDTANAVLKDAIKAYQDSLKNGSLPKFKKHSETTQWTLTQGAHRGGGVPLADAPFWKAAQLVKPIDGDKVEFAYRIGAAINKQYATGTIQMHRPLPEIGGIAEVVLKKSKIGNQFKYWIQYVLTGVKLDIKPAASGICALHMGWHAHEDGRIVAAIATSKHAHQAQVIELPRNVLESIKHSEIADSVRDELFNDSWPKIKEDLRSIYIPEGKETIDAEIKSICSLPINYVALSRLHRLLDVLQQENLGPSQFCLDWFKKDRALLMRSSAGRRKSQNQRQYFYRQLASQYAAKYQTLIVTKLNLKEAALKVNEVTGEKTEFNANARRGRVQASVSTLKECFVQSFRQRGGVVLEGSGALTKKCSTCGQESLVDNPKNMQSQDCTNCGEHYDTRKTNAAANLWTSLADEQNFVERYRKLGDEKNHLKAIAKQERLKKMQAARAIKRLESKTSDKSGLVTN